MVNLLSGSEINPTKFPNAHRWDTLVRQHFHRYQELIDAQTYRLQRIQRGLLSLPYPKYYNTELLTLNLLKRKQEVGEVDQNEVDLYKNINPCIATHFNRTFNSSFHLPLPGLAVGGAFFGFTSYFGFSVPTRIVATVVPIAVNWLWMTRDAKNEQHTLDFLNWVVGYRRAKCFAELHRGQFQSEQTRKVVGKGNLVDLGEQLFNLAGQ